ncbi:MAG TPA: hypothetical protein V6C81_11785 [Planktothrix sp.]|jgi:hypothetical protein
MRSEIIVSAIAITSCLPMSVQAQGYQDLNAAPQGNGAEPNLRGPMPGSQGTPTQYAAPPPQMQPVMMPDGNTRVLRSGGSSMVGDAVGAPAKAVKTTAAMTDRSVKTGVGMTDRTVKTGYGMTDRTVKTGVGLTDRAAKTAVGAPVKAVKETFKAIF